VIVILVITGKSCSGKDTIVKELEKLGYQRIITYTSRPIRPNEKDGVDYHFISLEEFFKRYLDDFFLEIDYFDVIDGIWFYGSSLNSYQNASDNTVAILTPSGLKKLKEHNIPFISFYINVSDEKIKQRQIERGDNTKEAERRFKSDKLDFIGIENKVDYIIDNEDRDVEEVVKEIDMLYRGEK